MSNIAIKGATTGTGTFTIESPATNTDRTLTLPDEAGTVLTSASTVAESQMFSGFANGITEWDAWRTTVNAGLSSGDVVGNQSEGWERFDNARFAKAGTGLSVSSGVWTFPSTGYWLIDGKFQLTSGGARNYIGIHLQATSDNGTNWDTLVGQYVHQEAGQYIISDCSYVVYIADTTNHKIRFRASLVNDSTLEGSTNYYYSGFQAIKISEV